jgi:DinB family protein
MNDQDVRELVAKSLAWEEAHVGFDTAVAGIPEQDRGRRAGAHSPWEIIEHIRLAQHDLLDFSVNRDYKQMEWPKDYWPPTPAPPSPAAWDESLAGFRRDREAFKQLALDTSIDVTQKIPHGDGQTYLRELLLVADHTAYHVGELVMIRQFLGNWKR